MTDPADMFPRRFLSDAERVRTTRCPRLPLVLEGCPHDVVRTADDCFRIFASAREDIRAAVRVYGGVLLRGFPLRDAVAFQGAIEALGHQPESLNPMDTSPRHHVAEKVFTSTDTPDAYPILAHNENCFLHVRPRMISFFCLAAPPRFGETPVFDSAAAARDLPDTLREQLARKKVAYVRRLPRRRPFWAPNVIRTWQEAFGTEDRQEIEAACARQDITCAWDTRQDVLRTRIVVEPLPVHPDTAEPCLHLQGFHRASLHADLDEVRPRQPAFANSLMKLGLATLCGLDLLPVSLTWGDGAPIPDADMLTLRQAVWGRSVLFRWQPGDLLVLDNFLTAHGRMNVVQPRKILTAFGNLVTVPLAA